jgi:hypothetical protein
LLLQLLEMRLPLLLLLLLLLEGHLLLPQLLPTVEGQPQLLLEVAAAAVVARFASPSQLL